MIFRRIAIIFLIFSLTLLPAKPASAQAVDASTKTTTPIKHLVVVMQENHTFDNYFGTYPGANGFPANTSVPVDPANPNAGVVTPWHLGNSSITDLSHNLSTFTEQYNNGLMNGFVRAIDRRNQNGKQTLGYYDGSDIPYYWNLADNYVLFDAFFSSAKEGSQLNHLFWVAGQAPKLGKGQTLADAFKSLPTIFDRLQEAGISWKFYVQNYDPKITYRDLGLVANRASQVIWVPLLAIDRFLDDPALNSHIVDLSQYYVDLRNGTLPAVAYIVPSGASEHPPGSPAAGQKFVKSLLQELMRSDAWDSSAFLLTYDDWGGWYDHVTPPQVDSLGYGLRVPALLISPYAPKGKIDSTQLDFTSILKFIEENWGIASLASRDAAANSIAVGLDFKQAPRHAEFISLARQSATGSSARSASVVYLMYGGVVVLFSAAAAIAFVRPRKLKKRALREEIE